MEPKHRNRNGPHKPPAYNRTFSQVLGKTIYYKPDYDEELQKMLQNPTREPEPEPEPEPETEEEETIVAAEAAPGVLSGSDRTYKIRDVARTFRGRLFSVVASPAYPDWKLMSNIKRRLNQLLINRADDDTIYKELAEVVSTAPPVKNEMRSNDKARYLLKRAKFIKKPTTYLDFGCGDGSITKSIGELLELPSSRVYGADVKLYKSPKIPAEQFALISQGNIPYDNEMFDLITCSMVLHHVPPELLEHTLFELNRVMMPDGMLIIREHSCIGGARSQEFHDLIAIQHEVFDRVHGQEELGGGQAIYCKPYDEWDRKIEHAGFVLHSTTAPTFNEVYNPVNKYERIYIKSGPETAAALESAQKETVVFQQPQPIIWLHGKRACDKIGYWGLYRMITENFGRQEYMKEMVYDTLHWGQMKLHLTEVEFLLQYYQLKKISPLAQPTGKIPLFVYAGAAPGIHINMLAEMFPWVEFRLYDPAPFTKFRHKNIQAFQQLFLNKDAEKWVADKHPQYDIMLVSDIRTGNHLEMSHEEFEECVKRDNKMQFEWYRIIKPMMSMFKFRLPWDDQMSTFPAGRIYIQAYPGQSSTETRLIIYEPDAPDMQYDNKKYEENLAYHNRHLRERNYHNPMDSMPLHLRRRKPGSWEALDDRYDCAVESYLYDWYFKSIGAKRDTKSIWEMHCKTNAICGGSAPKKDLQQILYE